MKIDRRCFLSLAGGLAVGHLLSPVPWKVTDDLAIWTQNWPWTPVPENGPVTYRNTVCTMCPGGCGIKVRMVKDRAVKIEGKTDYPINEGSLCPLGYSALQYLYGPSRVRSPMRRTGERGSGQFEAISWEDAIAEVTSKLEALRKNGKPQTLACISGSDKGTLAHLFKRLLESYGSPNFIRTPSGRDAHELSAYLAQGQENKNIGFDLENSKFILSFGTGLFDSNGSPGYQFKVYSRFGGDHTLVQVEHRLSHTAARANQWLPAKPGTEGALALGLAHVIIRDNLYNRSFIRNYAFGFEDWTDDDGNIHMGFKSLAGKYTPSEVSRITGIDAGKIQSLAREFARAENPVAITGYNECMALGNIDKTLAVHALNALVGNINRPGGMIVFSDPDYQLPEIKKDSIASRGTNEPRVDLAGTDKYPQSRYLLNLLPQIINQANGESPVQALLVIDANPVYTLEDSNAVKEAFAKIPFIVSFSSFMDETAQFSDIILPDHHFLEGTRDVPAPEGVGIPITGLSQPAIKPQYNTRHAGDTVINIAQALGGSINESFPWKGYDDFLKQAMGERYAELSKTGYWIDPQEPASWNNAFATPSGSYEFYPTARQTATDNDENKLPDFRQIEIAGNQSNDHLVLIPYNSPRIACGAIANPPFMTKTIDSNILKKDMLFVQINPESAKKLNLKQGDRAIIKTPAGEATVRVDLFNGLMPGMLAIPAGLGHTAYSRFIAEKGVNSNKLIKPVIDADSGLNIAWGVRATVQKA